MTHNMCITCAMKYEKTYLSRKVGRPKAIEKRERFNVVLRPSLRNKADRKAFDLDLSFSRYVEGLIAKDLTSKA